MEWTYGGTEGAGESFGAKGEVGSGEGGSEEEGGSDSRGCWEGYAAVLDGGALEAVVGNQQISVEVGPIDEWR